MKKLSVLFLKLSIFVLMIPVIGFGLYGLFWLSRNPVNPRYDQMIYPVLAGIYLASIPCLFAGVLLYQLVSHVGNDSLTMKIKESILKKLRTAAVTSGIIFTLMLPFIFMIAQEDDAPGLIIMAGVPILISMISAAIFTLFQGEAA